MRVFLLGAVVAVLAAALHYLPGRSAIPPLVESDYCYLLTAADRLVTGGELTTTQPVAPLQPWEWAYDWGFLTQWPAGYALLIAGLRAVFGCSSLAAASVVSAVAVASSFVGWFVWTRRCLSAGPLAYLLAFVAAGSAVSVDGLLNPSTDVILIGLLPWVMMLVADAASTSAKGEIRRVAMRLAAGGLLAGALFWIRYASVFVPVALGGFLLLEAACGRLAFRRVWLFGICATAPICALLTVNSAFGEVGSVQESLNLGAGARNDLSWGLIATAWRQYTGLGYYEHRAVMRLAFALLPAIALLGLALGRDSRRSLGEYYSKPEIRLSACLLTALLLMLVTATGLFGNKFNYVGLERYYVPCRPIYFALFVAPLVYWAASRVEHGGPTNARGLTSNPGGRRVMARVAQLAVLVGLVCLAIWTVEVDWFRTYRRRAEAGRERTPYGQWARCFTPNSAGFYEWIRAQGDRETIVVSNFHEYIALETGVPALPIPPNAPTLDRWVARIATARGVVRPRVLFALDPDNGSRGYWISEYDEVVQTFHLENPLPLSGVSARIFVYTPTQICPLTAG